MLFESLKMAWTSLMVNKLRAFLTMLGIIVGISSVITVVSLGEGGKNEVLGEFNKIGASTVAVRVLRQNAGDSDYIRPEDVQAIRDRLDSVRYASARAQRFGTATVEDLRKSAVLFGIDDQYTNIADMEILYGRNFTETEHSEGRAAALVDVTSAVALFGREDVVGEELSVGSNSSRLRVRIVGVTPAMGSGLLAGSFGSFAEDFPVFVYIPFQTVLRIYPGSARLSEITIMSVDPEGAEEAGAAVVRFLQSRHGNADRDVYRAETLLDVLDQFNRILGIITAFISAVAGISLLVGGIGVMNIMLVSVTERTREIGIRKAIGATSGDILVQFITESMILTMIGGIIGVAFGLAMAFGIGSLAGIVPVLGFGAIALAVLFSTAVGLFFGIYPARKAARLNPIDALRYE